VPHWPQNLPPDKDEPQSDARIREDGKKAHYLLEQNLGPEEGEDEDGFDGGEDMLIRGPEVTDELEYDGCCPADAAPPLTWESRLFEKPYLKSRRTGKS